MIWTFHALSLKTGQEPGDDCPPGPTNFFEIVSLSPKLPNLTSYWCDVLPAAFKAIGYALCKRHNHSFNRSLSIIPLSLSEKKLFRGMGDVCCDCSLRNCNINRPLAYALEGMGNPHFQAFSASSGGGFLCGSVVGFVRFSPDPAGSLATLLPDGLAAR